MREQDEIAMSLYKRTFGMKPPMKPRRKKEDWSEYSSDPRDYAPRNLREGRKKHQRGKERSKGPEGSPLSEREREQLQIAMQLSLKEEEERRIASLEKKGIESREMGAVVVELEEERVLGHVSEFKQSIPLNKSSGMSGKERREAFVEHGEKVSSSYQFLLALQEAKERSIEDEKRRLTSREVLEQRVAKAGLIINDDIDAEGDCLFDSVANQLFLNHRVEMSKDDVRQKIVTWLRENKDYKIVNIFIYWFQESFISQHKRVTTMKILLKIG